MSVSVSLSPGEKVPDRPFTDPSHSREDLERMRRMAHQLVDTYDDPIVCDFIPGKGALCKSDPLGRHYRIYYIRPNQLFELKNLSVVGFFGQKRANADIRPLMRADKLFEREFQNHPGLLSLSTVRLPSGDFGNLVLFTDDAAKDGWNQSPIHRDTVAEISPPYYRSIRLNNGSLPEGLAEPDNLHLKAVKYLDYSNDIAWRAFRNLE
jgi:hypothetical protein